MTDWREQEYEDNYWAERDAAITYQAFAHATDTWSPETANLFLAALEQAGATRAEERDEVVDDLTPVGWDAQGSPLYSWQVAT